MASTAILNPVSSSERARESRRRKKKMMKPQSTKHQRTHNHGSIHFSWKSEKTEQIYSSKLVEALRKVSLNSSPSPSSSSSSAPRRSRAVREAADRALAVAARGRTRWSRAILMTSRLKLKFMKRKKQRGLAAAAYGGANAGGRPRKPRLGILRVKLGNGKNLPAVQRKVRVLGRLVPGCRKESLPVILEEATDYIEALKMQIRTMTAVLNRAAGSGGSGLAADEPSGDHPPRN